jgi:hypothetical protein
VGVLKNPAYAGAYVHGRYASRRSLDEDGTVHTALFERPRAEWPVLIKDHHDGYITWAGYLANEARLAANRTNAGARPPREGCALCQGIIACGSCGKPMRTNYHTDQRPSYECSSRADRLTTPTCRSVAAATVDEAVAAVLLDALTPEQVALALAAADQVTDRHQRVSRAAELAVERARYDADRAERSFHQVEPENRLVARTLEARWETRLVVLAEAEQALEAARDALPPLPSRADLEKLAADLPALWHAPTTSNKDRKRLLRPICRRGDLRGRGRPAAELQHRRPLPLIHTEQLAARRGSGTRFCIPWNDETESGCRARIQQSAHLGRTARPRKLPAPPSHAADGEISVTEAAYRLACSIGVIYYWIETSQLAVRRGPGSRLNIPWDHQAETACRARIEQSGHLNPAARRTKPRKRR